MIIPLKKSLSTADFPIYSAQALSSYLNQEVVPGILQPSSLSELKNFIAEGLKGYTQDALSSATDLNGVPSIISDNIVSGSLLFQELAQIQKGVGAIIESIDVLKSLSYDPSKDSTGDTISSAYTPRYSSQNLSSGNPDFIDGSITQRPV